MNLSARKTFISMCVTTLLAIVLPAQAPADTIDDAKNILRGQGALVMDNDYIDGIYPPLNIPGVPFPIPLSALMMQTVPCLGNLTEPLCQNFANTAVTYAGFLWPGRPALTTVPGIPVPIPLPTCAPAAPPAIPFPPGSPLPSPLCAGAQLSEDEAIVLYGTLPPTGAYVGFEFSFHERHEDNIPGYPDSALPLNPAENPPPPASPGRVVISSSVGDTENTRVLPSGPNPDVPGGLPVFVRIMTGNAQVAAQVSAALVAAGVPGEAIFVKELPSSYYFSADAFADSYREILRIAQPVDQAALGAWIASMPIEPFRVTVPGVAFTGYPEVTHRPRETGAKQTKHTCNIAKKWEKFVERKYGKADVRTVMTPRDYDDEFCIATGTYCWGNNNDALYYNAMTTREDAMQTYDLSGPDSRVVIAGIDHVASGWADVWNWDIYDGEGNGRAFETFVFSEAQADDYTPDFDEFCGLNPGNCSCGGGPGWKASGCDDWTKSECQRYPEACAEAVVQCQEDFRNPLVGKLYWAQLRQSCAPEDPHCRELCAAYEPGSEQAQICEAQEPKRQIMQRVYLSPTTTTGPAARETRPARIFGYE